MPDYTLHHGDCLEIMRGMPDDSVHAVITDPPYNVGFKYDNDHDDDKEDYQAWCHEWLSESVRVSGGIVAISTGTVNVGMWYRISEPDWMVSWIKMDSCSNMYNGKVSKWEPIIIYGRHENFNMDIIKANISWKNNPSWHPCPKPLDWALKQVLMFSDEGDIILDPFSGSGTTGVACKISGRTFVGIERSEEYRAKAIERINHTTTEQLGLFFD
jgi:DNA modification methylase